MESVICREKRTALHLMFSPVVAPYVRLTFEIVAEALHSLPYYLGESELLFMNPCVFV